MFTRSAGPTEGLTPSAERRMGSSGRASLADRAASDQASALTRSALAFALRCHAGELRTSDDAPFIEHPLEVARLLRAAGCSDVLVAAGLLHEVMTSTEIGPSELTERFGEDVAGLVAAVSDDASVHSYRRRKQALREQVRSAGPDAAVLFAADRISRLRELPDQVMRDRARLDEAAPGSRVGGHLEYVHQLRLEHFQESLRMLQRVAARHPLVNRLADELDDCPIRIRRGAIVGEAAIGPRDERGRR